MPITSLKLIALAVISCTLATQSIAQRLPNVQQQELTVPPNFKADGIITEWGNLKAFNRATEIYYSIANDSKHLYLAVLAKDPVIIKKILLGGIKLTIFNNTSNNGIDRSISYPLIPVEKQALVAGSYADRQVIALENQSDVKQRKADSLTKQLNQLLTVEAKTIKATGFTGVSDSLISIYNDEGFKAAAAFDKDFNLSLELSFPIVDVKPENKLTTAVNYELRLEGASNTNNTHVFNTSQGPATVTMIPRRLGIISSANAQTINNATFFKGDYKFAK